MSYRSCYEDGQNLQQGRAPYSSLKIWVFALLFTSKKRPSDSVTLRYATVFTPKYSHTNDKRNRKLEKWLIEDLFFNNISDPSQIKNCIFKIEIFGSFPHFSTEFSSFSKIDQKSSSLEVFSNINKIWFTHDLIKITAQ